MKGFGASVLILIILEYIYIWVSNGELLPSSRLNPYYTGIHLHAELETDNQYPE